MSPLYIIIPYGSVPTYDVCIYVLYIVQVLARGQRAPKQTFAEVYDFERECCRVVVSVALHPFYTAYSNTLSGAIIYNHSQLSQGLR